MLRTLITFGRCVSNLYSGKLLKTWVWLVASPWKAVRVIS